MQKNKLLKPSSAIEDYFDKLLDPQGAGEARPTTVKSNIRIFSDLEAELSSIEQMAVEEPDSSRQTNEDSQQNNPVNALPEQVSYAERIEFPLQCLMFYVDNMQLSIPLIDLLSVVPEIKGLTRLPHAPDWFIGLIEHRDRKIKIVDTVKLLGIKATQQRQEEQHAIVLKDAEWGLTCDRPGEIVYLDSDDVKWAQAGNDGVLLGTIKQSLAVLLDAEKIIARMGRDQQQNLK